MTAAPDLSALHGLDTASLRERWVAAFKTPPPRHISRELLVRALAHQQYVETHGGLSSQAQRLLNQHIRALDTSGTIATTPRLSPGTRLVREWNGQVHEITVLDTGFLWKGKHHRSLSTIASAITGTRWSGPRFFGLKGAAHG